jgi:hypothetical protein
VPSFVPIGEAVEHIALVLVSPLGGYSLRPNAGSFLKGSSVRFPCPR